MKKLLFFLFLILVNSLVADTDIDGGDVFGIWHLSNSPYIVHGDITIPNGETLTIDPGVIIKFENFSTLNVEGRILAIGTNSDSIRFEENTNTCWYGIRFNNTSAENDSSKFVYSKISDSAQNGILIDSFSKLLIENSEFYSNAGAIKISSSEVVIKNSYLHDNIANYEVIGNGSYPMGGAIFCINSSVYLINNKICENSATDYEATLAKGGGIFAYQSNLVILDCEISNNWAESFPFQGSYGISKGGGICAEACNLELLNSTIADNNSSFSYNSNISIDLNSYLHILNTIFSNESHSLPGVGAFNNSEIDISYSCFNEGIYLDAGSNLITGDGNISIDPAFVNYNDYHLSNLSPCINRGTMNYPENISIPPFDLDGNPRVFQGSVAQIDMGTYEYQGDPVYLPEIDIQPLSLTWDFSFVYPPYQEKSLTISNTGQASLIFSATSSSQYFKIKTETSDSYSYSIEQIEVPPMSEMTLDAIFMPTEAGTFDGNILITSNDQDESEVNIALHGIASVATPVGGVISENTFWNSDSLAVTDDIIINDGVTLTIASGTKIIFTGEYLIDVQGTINAIGTSNDTIVFTYKNHNGHHGWHGIEFSDTPTTNDSSRFIYCKVEYIKNTSQSGFTINNYSKIKISNCLFQNNYGYKYGGVFNISNSSINLDNIIFYNNEAYKHDGNPKGGAIYTKNNSYVNIRNCKFIENVAFVADSGASYGGACSFDDSQINITSSLFYKNHSDDFVNPDQVYLSAAGAISSFNSSVNITNSSFVDNYTQFPTLYPYPYAFMLSNSNMTLINSIVLGYFGDSSEIFDISNSTLNFLYSDIFGDEDDLIYQHNSEVNWLEGNLNIDPLFINHQNEDYHLAYNSPLINAGTPDTTGLFLQAYDLDGNPRIYDGRIDIGCYEWQGNAANNDELTLNNYKLTNYPNPFNPTTTISFNLPQNVKNSKIEIYNLKGQRIRSFPINRLSNSAVQQIVWNGKNDAGKSVSSGVYFYRLNVDSKVKAVRKCVLMK